MATGSSPDTQGNSRWRTVSTVCIVLGIALLAIMPTVLLFFAVTAKQDPHIPGTLVIISSAGGMALIVIGAAMRS